jgi:adenine-specific DNA methylase
MNQRFIEHDLPLAEVSDESAREKNINHGHPSSLHIWWARRPLAASRATTLAALLDDPGPHKEEERREIKDLIKEIVPWDAVKSGNSEGIKRAQELVKEQYEDPPKVLDPFAGGGSIPLEALRLGADTHASDYNPVAVFVEKATLEWPQKFGIEVRLPKDKLDDGLGMGGKKVNLLAYLVEKWSNKVLEETSEEIGQFYPTETGEELIGKREVDPKQDGWTPVGYLWARTIPCQNPTCSATIPLIKQFWLCKRESKKIAYRPIVNEEDESIDFEILHGKKLSRELEKGFDPKDGTVSRADATCPVCRQVTKAKKTRKTAREGKMGERLIAVVLDHPNETGKKYRLADKTDTKNFDEAEKYLSEKKEKWSNTQNPLPNEKIEKDPRRLSIFRYGMEKFKDLYNPRQNLCLLTFSQKIRESFEEIKEECEDISKNIKVDKEELAKAVVGYVSISLSTLADKNARMVEWQNHRECIGHIFSRQAIPMGWDYFEINPMSDSTGNWKGITEWSLRYLRKNEWNSESSVEVKKESAPEIDTKDEKFDAVLTDPPYYDSVPYSSLSDLFYVWLKRSVGNIMPELFSTPVVPKSDEAVMEKTRHDSKESAKNFFEETLKDSFEEIHRVLKPEGIAVVVYAHKTTEGWESMLSGLVNAGLVVTGSWPLHTEMRSRLAAAQTAALASSIYMVCRKTEREELGFWSDIQPQIKARVEEKLEQFWEADVIRGGDFFISAIGPGMEAYSRYDRVETYSGEEITVRDLLQYIRGVATDFLVRQLLRDVSAGSVDKEGQFYLTYRWTFRDTRVEYDDALRIAKAEGVNIDRIAERDSFIKKTRKYIYVHGPQDRDRIEEVHDMVDAMHLACQMWEDGRGDDQIGKMLAKYGYGQSPSFWQFCQGVSECLPDGKKEKQWLEGMLMSKDQYQQAEATGDGESSEGQMQIGFENSGSS